eukprot:CAMPEP_0113856678 /NCGR_PEP_ID=MMETSP0372-20130328/9421_1 /TAXON_ID=340204 /ORGANISM="Lankesteria abbotti" /LENGTH=85 /DNA_ID=CAMNT_0000831809 /DNA_START=78 /DNA_END=332 /DNA_ORIENTATION=- /assembly_acc=CAM_ASM_000359
MEYQRCKRNTCALQDHNVKKRRVDATDVEVIRSSLHMNAIADFGKGSRPNRDTLALSQLIENDSGHIRNVLLANYMIDLGWLLDE